MIERQLGLGRKSTPPGLPTQTLVRDRLNRLFGEALGQHPVLIVASAAGTGKTVQAQVFASQSGLPFAWRTLDPRDASPSRFLSGLAISVSDFASESVDAVHRALRVGASTQEAAAALAETINATKFLLVIDEAEHLLVDEGLLPGLGTFLEYAPETMRTLVLGREPLGDPLRRRVLDGTYSMLVDEALRMTIDETAEFLELRGFSSVDAPAACEATGGWVAGLAFGSIAGSPPAAQSRELVNYLRDDLIARLPDIEQEFLIKASLADTVTPGVADALLGSGGAAAYWAVRGRHLPAVTSNDESLVCHSVLRSFFRTELALRYPGEEGELLRRGATYFGSISDFERSTEWSIRASDRAAAANTAEQVLSDLYERADWATLSRWLEFIGDAIIADRPALLAARVRTVYGSRRFDEATKLIRHLDQSGQLRPATEADQGLLAIVGWALQGDAAEARRYLDKYNGDYRVEAMRYMLDATTGLEPAVPPVFAGDDMVRLMSWGLLWQGRLTELARMQPVGEDLPVLNPNLILAHLWRGDADTARAMWSRVPEDIRRRAHSRFIEACILLGEDRAEAALEAVRAAVADSRRIGFGLDSVYEVFTALIIVARGSPLDAITIVEHKLDDIAKAGQLAIAELAQTVRGSALLLDDRPAEARLILEDCVLSMTRAQRRLFLPAAAVYLSEAYARLGDDEAAHQMAVQAHHAASVMGSYWWMVHALRAVPAVLQREVERDPDDSRWRRLLVARSAKVEARPVATSEHSSVVEVETFGPHRDLIVNGVRAGIGRMKVLELAACLCLHPGGIDRFELQRRLFPDVDQRRGGNHFRQIAHKLREVTGITLGRSGQLVVWPDDVVVESSDVRFERLVAGATSLTGRERFDRLRDAVALATGGYLESSDIPWVEERRYHLDIVREEALTEFGELALELGEFQEAGHAAERILEFNPYSEQAYVLLLRVEHLAGTPASCQAVYRRSVEALGELGLKPADLSELLRSS